MNSPLVFTANEDAFPSKSTWLLSWPLIMGVLTYLFAVFNPANLLRDGDTYWHIASGHWILRHGSVPASDPFSHTMPGAPWTAHEWLSEVLLALAHDAGQWSAVVALTGCLFGVTVAVLTRALLKYLEPVHALFFAAFAVAMTAGHLLARPHILAMPLMMIWTIELVRASESGQAPRPWLLPVMTVWANMHGGFTLGLALACAFALEAVLAAWPEQRFGRAARSWGIFVVLALASALITPHGIQGILYTWQIFFESGYALQTIGEWQSPSFQRIQPLEIWLLAGLAVALHQGLRLPPIRLILLLGFLHLALKHARNIELLGLLIPLFLAGPLAQHWRTARPSGPQLETVDQVFRKLAQRAGLGASLLAMGLLLFSTMWMARARPLAPPDSAAPAQAIAAVRQAGITGPVLNHYSWGGYLIYLGIPAFIDGRADMYRDDFLKAFMEALALKTTDGLEQLLRQHQVEWTLLPPGTAGVAMLDHLPQWRRLHTDSAAVVHVRTQSGATNE